MKAIIPYLINYGPQDSLDLYDLSDFFNMYALPDEIKKFLGKNFYDKVFVKEDVGYCVYGEDFVRNMLDGTDLQYDSDFTVDEATDGPLGYVITDIEDSALDSLVYSHIDSANKVSQLIEFIKECDRFGYDAVSETDIANAFQVASVNGELEDEINSETTALTIDDLSSEAVGLILAFIAFDNSSYTNVDDFFNELANDTSNYFTWSDYYDFGLLVDALNAEFKFEPELTDKTVFQNIEHYVKDENTGKYVMSIPKFETFKDVGKYLKVFLEDFSMDAFNYMKKEHGLSDDDIKNEFAAKNNIDTVADEKGVYYQALQKMAPNEIDHHGTDLYIKKTPVSDEIVANYEYKGNVQIFRDQIDNELWYEFPFEYIPEWQDRLSGRAYRLPNIKRRNKDERN